jgi:hypothetical protein
MLETASSGRHVKEIGLPQRYFVSLMMVSVVFASSVILCVCLGASILCVMPEEVLFPPSHQMRSFNFTSFGMPKLPRTNKDLYGSLTDTI